MPWQGQVTVSLNITESSFPSSPVTLNLKLGLLPLNSSAKDIYSHTIGLQQVEPYPIRDQTIAKSDYSVTLVVFHRSPTRTPWKGISQFNGLLGISNITLYFRKEERNLHKM
jgi:hypothetical protein